MTPLWHYPLVFPAGKNQYLYTHLSSIFSANAEPLSVFNNRGSGRLRAMLFSISATSVERRLCPTQIPRHSRMYRSITVNRCTGGRQTEHQRQNLCPRHGSDTAPEAGDVALYLLRCGLLRRRDSPCSR